MGKSLLLLAVLYYCFTFLISAETAEPEFRFNSNSHTILSDRIEAPLGWGLLGKVSKDSHVVFYIHLKLQNTDALESLFWSVSDPKDPNYGKFLTREEVQKLIAPSQEALDLVLEWLHGHGATTYQILNGYAIKVRTTALQAERLFGTQLFAFSNSHRENKLVTKHLGKFSIPSHLAGIIELVTGLTEFPHDTKFRPSYATKGKEHDFNVGATDIEVTVSLLQKYYNVPAASPNAKNLQAIAAFGDYFSAEALAYFDSNYHLAGSISQEFGSNCITGGCDQGESDLDVQYMSNLGQNVTTWFIEESTGWILEWAEQVAAMTNPPLIHSISYGAPEVDQCLLDPTTCSSLGLTSATYISRTNTELQVLGSMGLTVLAACGDDGSTGFYNSPGNNPLNTGVYCPAGGCTHTSTQCGAIIISYNGQPCVYPNGVSSQQCAPILNNTNLNTAIESFSSANPSCTFDFDDTDSQGLPHVYSTCACSAITPYSGLGFTISAYSYSAANGPALVPNYPASSPYLTSVGATQFETSSTGTVYELPANVANAPFPAIITTGGGFSTYTPQPSYQATAVKTYLTSGVTLPPSGLYNPSNRAYPDIAMNGHNFQVSMPTGSDTGSCPCSITSVDGTSCASPSLAGMLSLINDQLLNAGHSPLGFINTALYQIASTTPQAFNDIQTGNNTCNRGYCFEWGYNAAKGWDPVTGLGSPNFAYLGPALLTAKGVKIEELSNE